MVGQIFSFVGAFSTKVDVGFLPKNIKKLKMKAIGQARKSRNESAGLKSDQCVMFLPDIAYQQADGCCVASIQAWVYKKQHRRGLTRVLAMLLGIDISTLGEDERRLLYERTQLFRVDCERGRILFVVDAAGTRHALPKTNASGRTNHIITLPLSFSSRNHICQVNFYLEQLPKNVERFSRLKVVVKTKGDTHEGELKITFGALEAFPKGKNQFLNNMPQGEDVIADYSKAKAFFAPREGLCIISDIDDTIKQSFVWDTKHLLRNTFLEYYRAVDDMAAWYQALSARGNVAFHYVSCSPIQLYPVLYEFMRREKFPEGSMHLREATRWTGIIPRINASKKHKTGAIERLLQAYPQRQFILIGDSGEEDSVIYADCMRRHPNQIRAICIRHLDLDNKPTMYKKIFADLDKKFWLVSNDVAQLRQFVEDFH